MYVSVFAIHSDKHSNDGKIFNKKLDRLREKYLSGKHAGEYDKD